MQTQFLCGSLMLLVLSSISTASAEPYSGHGAQSVAPEVLSKYAPQPLPDALARSIQSMLDIRAPGMGITDPAGKNLYFTWSVTGVPQIWKLDHPKGFPIQLTGGQDPTYIESISPDGKWLVVSRDRRGEENPGLYLQKTSGGALIEIQHKPEIRTIYEFATDDSRYIYFRSNDIKPDSYAIYRYEIATGKKEKIFDEPGLWSVSDFQPNPAANVKLLLEKSTGSRSSEFFEWDTQERKLTPVLGQGEKEEYVVRYSAHPGEFLVLTPKLGEFRRLYRFKAGKLTPITPEMKMDVSDFAIDYPRAHIAYDMNDGGYTRLAALDARTYRPIQLPKFEADHVYLGSMTRNGKFMGLGVETAQAPRTSYIYEWKSRKLTQWVIPSSPEVDTSGFAVAKLEYYPAHDGTRIPMFVRRPARCTENRPQPCPVIVSFHGGPETQSTPGFSTEAQLFVDAGFVFVEPNVRGSDGYGKTWIDSDNGPNRLTVITDIEDCGKYIREKWALHGKKPKIGITGGSYGGYSTLIGMTRFAGIYDAGVSIVGMSNLLTFLNNTAPYRRMLRATEYGDPEKDKQALIDLSPMTYLDRLKSPLMLIQGASDPRVPAGEAIQIHEALAAKKVASELILFADEGHGSKKRDNRVLQIGHTLRFFLQHLAPAAQARPGEK